MIHDLKIFRRHFEAIKSGSKRCEVRKNDRGFKAGNYLRLKEYHFGKLTGREIMALVTHIDTFAMFKSIGFDDVAVMSIEVTP